MIVELWTYRTFDRDVITDQLKGFKVEAQDGSIGKIDEATDEVGRSYIVVDTGPWIFGRKVVIPAGAIERIDWDDEKVYVALTKDQVKNSPEFDPERGYDNDEYHTRLGSYYDTEMRRAS
jgi:hypothetical protein